MAEETGKYLCIAALATAGALAAWTAWACRRARLHGLPGSDAIVWAAMALVYLLLAQTKLARVLGWLKSLGAWLRVLARQQHAYANRRPYQIAVTLTVAVIVGVLLVIGLVAMWNYIKRYRLAIGFTGLAVGFSVIRFISLHEVDAWNAAMPWMRVVIELTAAVGASAVAMARLWQLRSSRTCGDRRILPVGPSDQHCS
jgi:hypothetical protein